MQNEYQKTRDLVWEMLIKRNISSLPVKISDICRAEGVKVIPYSAGGELLKKLNLEERARENDGLSNAPQGQRLIFYNDSCIIGRQRFTVAHELGHHILGHVGKYELVCREPHPQDNPIERDANIFASRILAPACVLWGLKVETAEQISRLCNISNQAAQFRMDRLNILYNRRRFLTSDLEWQVYAQFEPYIRKHRRTWFRRL